MYYLVTLETGNAGPDGKPIRYLMYFDPQLAKERSREPRTKSLSSYLIALLAKIKRGAKHGRR